MGASFAYLLNAIKIWGIFMDHRRRAIILSYVVVIFVMIFLIISPFLLEWDLSSAKAILFFGGASSIMAALILATLTSWISRDNYFEISKEIATNLKGLLNNIDIGLENIFKNRNESLDMQKEILKEGNQLFILATTLNSLLKIQTAAINIICRRSFSSDWSLNILINNPSCYSGQYDILKGQENIGKVIKNMKKIKEYIDSNKLNDSQIRIGLINKVPAFFMVGNENSVIVSHYDYQEAGSQPVFRFEKTSNGIYSHYKNQFDELVGKITPITISEVLELLTKENIH